MQRSFSSHFFARATRYAFFPCSWLTQALFLAWAWKKKMLFTPCACVRVTPPPISENEWNNLGRREGKGRQGRGNGKDTDDCVQTKRIRKDGGCFSLSRAWKNKARGCIDGSVDGSLFCPGSTFPFFGILRERDGLILH